MRHNARILAILTGLMLVLAACGDDDVGDDTAADDDGGDADLAADEDDGEDAADEIDYPERQIEIIVPFGAGGGVDINARNLAPHLSEQLGVNVVVENRTGAGGITGHTLGATAEPDGYVLTFVSPGIIGGPLTEEGVDFEPTDYEFVAQVTEVPNFVTVDADAPWETVGELADDAAEQTLTTGRQASMTSKSIALELFLFEADIEANVTTGWEGGAELLAGLITGDVDFSMHDANELRGRDDVRALCASAGERSEEFPDVPTCAEEGFERVTQGVWRGLAASQGTPQEIVDVLQDAVEAALETEELQADFEEAALTIDYLTGEEFEQRVEDETETLTEVFRDLGVLVE